MYDLELGQDLATLQNRSSRSTASSSDMINSRKNHNILDQFLGFSMAPGIGVGDGLDYGGVGRGEVIAFTPSQLCQIDLRQFPNRHIERLMFTHTTLPLEQKCLYNGYPFLDYVSHQRLVFTSGTWIIPLKESVKVFQSEHQEKQGHRKNNASKEQRHHNPQLEQITRTPSSKKPSTEGFISILALPCGDLICLGSSSGYVHCFERRKGNMLLNWKAHSKAVIAIKPYHKRHFIVTVSRDRTALLWDLRTTPPKKLSTISGLPKSGSGMNSQTVILQQFDLTNDDSNAFNINSSDDNSNDLSYRQPKNERSVLYAASGHKAASASIPDSGSDEISVEPRKFRDINGNKISKKSMCIQSMLLLPLRQLVLLGSDNGHVKVSV